MREVVSRMTATTPQLTIAPTIRAKTSKSPPSRIASEATTATTSPVGVWRGRASPTSALCQPTSWIERNAARSQLCTEK